MDGDRNNFQMREDNFGDADIASPNSGSYPANQNSHLPKSNSDSSFSSSSPQPSLTQDSSFQPSPKGHSGLSFWSGLAIFLALGAGIFFWWRSDLLSDEIDHLALQAEQYQQTIDNGFANKQGDRIIGDLNGNSATINLDTTTIKANPNQNATIILGDSSGATSFVIQNSNGLDIASLNSLGNFGLDGKIICANCIALGSETTGNYVKSLKAGSDIIIFDPSGEGTTPTIFNISTFDSVTARGATTNHAIAINDSGNALTFNNPNAAIAFNTGVGRLYDSSGNLYYNSTNLTAGGALPAGVVGQTIYHNGLSWIATSNLYNDGTNIGINTTSPSNLLTVKGTTTEAYLGTEKVTNGDFSAGDTGWSVGANWSTATGAAVHTAGSTAVLSQDTGEVANEIYQVVFTVTRTAGSITMSIGGTTDYAGAISSAATYTRYIKATDTSDLTFTPSSDFAGSIDNVSVKKVNPTAAIAVLQNSSGTSNMEFRAGGSDYKNVFIGQDAGSYTINTYYPSFGTVNVGIGYQALYSNTTGAANVAIGYQALYSHIAGNANVAIGYQALYSNTTGYGDAIGYQALYSNTTGWSSHALGYRALYSNTTGNYNTALGGFALQGNTTGSSNIALGDQTLQYNTTGTGNTALGVNADYGYQPAHLGGTVAAGGNLNAGTYYYKLTFTLNGSETVLGTASAAITTTDVNKTVNLTSVRLYSGSMNCTGRKIYRTKTGDTGTSNTKPYYLVASIGDNTTTTYTDIAADDSLGALYDGPDYSLMLGYGALASASNQLVIGGTTGAITNMYIGKGIINSSPSTSVTINTTGGDGTNKAGSNLILAGGISTGSGTGGYISFQTTPASGSGLTQNTLTERLRIDSAGSVSIPSANITGTTTSSSLSLSANSLTSGTGLYVASSTLSSGSLIDVAVTGTAAASNTQKALNIATQGANGTATQTTYGLYIANTHTGATSTNIGLYATASGATNNYAAIFDAGNVGIGTTTPATTLDVNGTVKGQYLYDQTDVKYWGAKGDGTTDDTAAFQAALANAKTVKISQPGTYMLTAPLYLSSNQTLEGSANVTLKKKVVYSHILVNSAATTAGYLAESGYDTSITVRNLILDDGPGGDQTGAASPTSNGIVNFSYATKVLLENITVHSYNDGVLYAVHLQPAIFSTIKNITIINSWKDGIHLSGGSHDIVVDGFDVNSYDDSTALTAGDWPRTARLAKDIYNIAFKNGISHSDRGNTGRHLLLTGSWLAWNNGNTYRVGNVVVNAGNLYKMINLGPLTGTVAPVHPSGDITGADGIQWRWVGQGTNTEANIYNISWDNINFADGRAIHRTYDQDPVNDYSTYPGTEANSYVDGIYLSNIIYDPVTGNGSYAFNSDAGTTRGTASVIFAAGNTGLGTTMPGVMLDVRKDNAESELRLSSITGTNAASMAFINTGGWFYVGSDSSTGLRLNSIAQPYAGTLMTTGNYPLAFGTNNTTRMVIDNGGDALFYGSIQGAAANGLLVRNNTVDGTDNKQLLLAGGGNASYTQGAYIDLKGNEYATNPGSLTLYTGNVAGNYFDLYTSGTRRLRVDENGKVGIGTTLPTKILSFGGETNRTIWVERNTDANVGGATLTIQAGGTASGDTNKVGGDLYLSSGISTGSATSSIYFQTATAGGGGITDNTPSTKMTILGSGYVGIGNTPASSLDINGIILSRSAVSGDPTNPTEGLGFGLTGYSLPNRYKNSIFNSVSAVASGASMQFRVANGDSTQATVMTLRGSGYVGIGDTTPAAMLTVGDGDLFQVNSSGAIAAAAGITSSGTITFSGLPSSAGAGTPVYIDGSNNLFKFTSSLRYKHDVTDIELDTNNIYKLRPVSYTPNGTNQRDFGLIAEEVAQTFPQLAIYDNLGRPDSVRYESLSVLLLNELQKQHKDIENLKTQTSGSGTTLNISGALSTAGISITNNDISKKTIGQAVIPAHETSVVVNTQAIAEKSRIFVTPVGSNFVNWIVSDIKAGESFQISIKDSAETDTTFNWWMVEEK